MRYVEATAPTVIDETLSRACIQLLQPKELSQTGVESESYRHQAANKQATLPFVEVECLMFSFKNVLKINNLVGFDRLVKLYLDNNVIVRIENLDHLANLEWLDLSFNNIEQISGLSNLSRLENLSLFNNKIKSLDGLDALVDSLQVLSLGNNQIKDLERTRTLRKFPKLHAVTFAGNPMAAKDDYRAFVLAHLRHLQFLDYRLVDESEVAQAESDGALQEKLQEIRVTEQQQEESDEIERKVSDRSSLLRHANMGALNGFWGRMDTATAEFTGKVNVVEQLAELHGRQRSKFEQRLHEFVEANLAAIANKEKEAREFGEAASTMLAENDSEALAHIATFNAAAKAAKKLFAQRGGSTELDAQRDEAISSLREGNEALHEQLLEIEMMQVDQFIAAIDSFEATYTGMHGTSVEAISITFNALRELATGWTAEALEIASERHDWFVAENLSESDDLADELKAVLNDKEGMEGLTGIEGAAEARLSFLDATEESVAKAEKAAFNAVLNALREGEHRRNRQRVNEVSHLVHTINQELLDKLDKLNNAAEGEEPIIW